MLLYLIYRLLLFRRSKVFKTIWWFNRGHLSSWTLLSPRVNFSNPLPWWDLRKQYRYNTHSWKSSSVGIKDVHKNVHLFVFLTKGAEMCDECPSGTYCLSGEGVQPCPVGHYCLGGGVEGILPCPPGTYSPRFGLRQVEQCLICPAGGSVVTSFLALIGILHIRSAAEMDFNLLSCNLFTGWIETNW